MGGVTVGEISNLWVDSSARRMGIAAKLCRTGIDWLRAQDVHSIEAQVLRGNEASQKLFEDLGFVFELRMSRLHFK
jgi:ribosomal protein S18 acetylase RimI-like enzyme